jgi:hypothetical protein
MNPLARRALLAAHTLAVVSLLGACGEQGIGERCDLRNGKTADCASGLECTHDVLGVAKSTPTGGDTTKNAGICCPPEGESTAVEACFRNKLTFSPGDAAVDATSDARADAPSDGSRSDAAIPDGAIPPPDSSINASDAMTASDARPDGP